MTPLERADKVRDMLRSFNALVDVTDLPPGSLILTPDEAEKIKRTIRVAISRQERDEVLALLAGKGQT